MIRIAFAGALWLALVGFAGVASPVAAQAVPPKLTTFQLFTKGGSLTPSSAAIPPPKPIEIKPGSVLTTFPDGSASIEDPPPSLDLPANTVPFTLTASGQILLTAHVGAHTLHFVLDTGASSTGLLPATAAALKVRLNSKAHSVPGVKFGTLSEVALGDIQLTAVPVVVTEMEALSRWNSRHPDQQIDGILGIDTLQHWAIGLDMPAQTVTFWPGGHVDQKQIAAFQIAGLQRYGRLPNHQELIKTTLAQPMPMHHRAEDAQHPFYTVSVQIDQVEAEMDVDTGALITVVPSSVAVGLKPIVTSRSAVGTLTGSVPMTTLSLRAIKIGPLTVDFPQIAAPSAETPNAFMAAILGRTCFDRCQIVLDFPASTLSIARLMDESNARVLLPAMGIFPRMQEDRLSVLVQPGSAAAEAGILQDDQILSVAETNTLLPGTAQPDPSKPSDLTLTIRRAGTAEPLTFSLRVLWVTAPLVGHELAFPEGGRLYMPGKPGGVVMTPDSKIVPAIDYLLLFNPKRAASPSTLP